MKYLLDTHILLWAVESPGKLSAQAGRLIRSEKDQLFVSIASPWELAIKANAGKLDVAELLKDFERTLSRGGYHILETTVAQVIRAGSLQLHHSDPFDRLLAAQALDLRIPLISRDPVFDAYGVHRIWN